MALTPLTHLSVDSQRQYQSVYNWFCATYKGDMLHTTGIQKFVDNHPEDVVRNGLRGRILRSIIDRYLNPRPVGPSISICKRKRRYPINHKKIPMLPWLLFVPRYIHKSICNGVVVTPDGTSIPNQNWMHWTQSFVSALGAHVLRRNLIRSYVAYVHRIIRPLCHNGETISFLGITRQDIINAMLYTHSSIGP
jgi:hypothetical protein